jgi:hypothetical protein
MAENKRMNSEETKDIQETKNDVHEFLVTSEFLNEFVCPNGKKFKPNDDPKCCADSKCPVDFETCKVGSECSDPKKTDCCDQKTDCCVNANQTGNECDDSTERKRRRAADKTIDKILKLSGFYPVWENLCKSSDVRGLLYMNLFLRNLVDSKFHGKGPNYLDVFSTEELKGALEQLNLVKSQFEMIQGAGVLNDEEEDNEDSEEDENDDSEEDEDEDDENVSEDDDSEEDEDDDDNVSEDNNSEKDENDENDSEDEDTDPEDDDESTTKSNNGSNDEDDDICDICYEEDSDESICDAVSRKIVNSPSVHLLALLSWFYMVYASVRM